MRWAACCVAARATARSSTRYWLWQADDIDAPQPSAGAAVGSRIAKLDGAEKVSGTERYGADRYPAGSLWLRVVRSPHARAEFRIGDLRPLLQRHPGLTAVLTAADVPQNSFGIFPADEGPAGTGTRTRALLRRGGAGAGRRAECGHGDPGVGAADRVVPAGAGHRHRRSAARRVSRCMPSHPTTS